MKRCGTRIVESLQVIDSLIYNYKSRHPATALLEKVGFDTFQQNLNKCIVSQPKRSIQSKIDSKHPETNYLLYNYVTTTLPQWCEYSKLCRGLVIDPTNKKLIATPFAKFFNYAEYEDDREMTQYMNEMFNKDIHNISISDKPDGSLGIMYYCDIINKWRVNTRGSFDSPQASWADKFINDNIDCDKGFIKGHTYLFEIINCSLFQSVIYYNFKGLILLSAYNNDGYEYTRYHLEKIANLHQPFGMLKLY